MKRFSSRRLDDWGRKLKIVVCRCRFYCTVFFYIVLRESRTKGPRARPIYTNNPTVLLGALPLVYIRTRTRVPPTRNACEFWIFPLAIGISVGRRCDSLKILRHPLEKGCKKILRHPLEKGCSPPLVPLPNNKIPKSVIFGDGGGFI